MNLFAACLKNGMRMFFSSLFFLIFIVSAYGLPLSYSQNVFCVNLLDQNPVLNSNTQQKKPIKKSRKNTKRKQKIVETKDSTKAVDNKIQSKEKKDTVLLTNQDKNKKMQNKRPIKNPNALNTVIPNY